MVTIGGGIFSTSLMKGMSLMSASKSAVWAVMLERRFSDSCCITWSLLQATVRRALKRRPAGRTGTSW